MKSKIILLLGVFSLAFLIGCGSAEPTGGGKIIDSNSPDVTNDPGQNRSPAPDLTAKTKPTITMQLAPKKEDTIAILTTNYGEMDMLLYREQAPETAKNFIELSKQGKYDGTIFHRVIKDFMIQGGDFERRNGTGGYSYKGKGTNLQDEFGEGLTHVKGAVSMANAGPDTGGSQFFIVQNAGGTSFLDGKHAIFGYVYKGLDVLDKIAAVQTGANDKPVKDVILQKVEIKKFQ